MFVEVVATGDEVIDEGIGDVETNKVQWAKWLGDSWYGEIVHYLLFHSVQGTSQRIRKVRHEAKKYILLDAPDSLPQLAYQEPSGELSACIRHDRVAAILHRFHNNHGHYSASMMGRNLLGRYYWPGRLQDIARWCASCNTCQKLGPCRNSTQIQPIMSLQPMDLMGMDFVGPISPHSVNGSVYIILTVDYFSRYLFAHATKRNTGEAVVEFLSSKVAKTFGWPLAFYVDNGSHFVKGKLPSKLKEVGTKLFNAPITNPRSVGLEICATHFSRTASNGEISITNLCCGGG